MQIKIKKLMLLMLVVLLPTLTVFSQKTVLNSKGDTLIIFTPSQARFLQKQYYHAQESARLNVVCEKQLLNRDSTITDQEQAIQKHKLIEKNMREIDVLKQHEIEALKASLKVKDEEVKTANKATKKQRNLKRAAALIGTLTTGFMTYLWVIK